MSQHNNHEHSEHNHENHHHTHSCACSCQKDHVQEAASHDHTCSCAHEHSDGCGCGHDHGNIDHIKPIIIRIIIGAVIFAAGFIFPNIHKPLFIISYIILGYDVVLSALKNITKGHVFDENFLMSIATIGAFIIGEFPEAVAVMLFYQVGELFQNIAVNRSKKSITELMDIRPDYANILINGEYKKVAPDSVHKGDSILVKAGEKIPLDGTVLEGNAFLDTSALTGESVPRKVTDGDAVLSGSINTNGNLTIKVDKEFAESTASRILDLVENSASKKSASEKFITKFARYYTPIVVIFAFILAVIPPFFTGGNFSQWIYQALIFLVVSCPCALVVSVPLGFFGGIGCASKNGILLKGSSYLEMLTKIDTIVFDKTGTLTKGVFEVSKISGSDDLLKTAAYAEFYSNHPIASSIKQAYKDTIDVSVIQNYEEQAGYGISVTVNHDVVLAGNEKLMKKYGISFDTPDTVGTVIHVAKNNIYLGYIVISDKIKADSKTAIEKLNRMQINTVMLTGDNRTTAENIGKQLGISTIYSELLPNEKVEHVETLLADSHKTAFTGDGINDAPVLARADVGIAMGGVGSDAAIEAADMVIMTDETSKIPDAIKISKSTMQIVWQNIIFALGIKFIIMILSIFGISTMWMAIFADVGVSLLAVCNSIRALYIRV